MARPKGVPMSPEHREMLAAGRAVGAYLDWLENPNKAPKPRGRGAGMSVEDKIKKLEEQISAPTTSVIKRAKLMQQVRDLKSGKVRSKAKATATRTQADYEEGFIKYGKKWAESQGIEADVLAEIGVPEDVLKKAGFKLTAASKES